MAMRKAPVVSIDMVHLSRCTIGVLIFLMFLNLSMLKFVIRLILIRERDILIIFQQITRDSIQERATLIPKKQLICYRR